MKEKFILWLATKLEVVDDKGNIDKESFNSKLQEIGDEGLEALKQEFLNEESSVSTLSLGGKINYLKSLLQYD